MREIMRKILKVILNIPVHIAYRVKIMGKENIPKESGAILCQNHVHALDPAIIVLTAKRKVQGLAKAELYSNIFLRFLGKTFGMHPVKRETADMSAIKTSLRILKE